VGCRWLSQSISVPRLQPVLSGVFFHHCRDPGTSKPCALTCMVSVCYPACLPPCLDPTACPLCVQVQAKASNVFTRGELHNMLAPALLEPCADPAAAAYRVELMRVSARCPPRTQPAAALQAGLVDWSAATSWPTALCCNFRLAGAVLACLPESILSARHVFLPPACCLQYLYEHFGQRGDTHISPLFRPGACRMVVPACMPDGGVASGGEVPRQRRAVCHPCNITGTLTW
jgi:hypothetical protein